MRELLAYSKQWRHVFKYRKVKMYIAIFWGLNDFIWIHPTSERLFFILDIQMSLNEKQNNSSKDWEML